MAKQVQHRRGTTAQHAAFTGALGEFTYDTDKKTVVVHDGVTAGGFPLVTLTGSEALTNKTISSSSGAFTTLSASTSLSVSGVADTATAATHYYVETGSDGFVRPKTLANVRTEIVTTAAVNAAAATTVGTVTSGTWNAGVINSTYGGTGVNNGGRTLTVNTNSGTIAFSAGSLTLTVAAAASVSGTNTGDQTTVSGNAGSATVLQTARNINGVSFNGSADILVPSIYDANYRRITQPGGAEYVTSTASITGAIRITLPVGGTNTMVRMTIKVYEYTTGESFEIHCGGYTYSVGPTWANNPFAYIVGAPNIDRRFTVRFGYTAGLKMCVYIGELASSWSYPQVFVTDVQMGYSGMSSSWASGWAIGFEAAAFENVTATLQNIQVGYAESTNVANSVVLRDSSGNFAAGAITATRVQLNNSDNLTWGGAYGATIPTIAATVGTGITFYPTGSSSGGTFSLGASAATLTTVLGSYGSDSATILTSYNTSASNAQQFVLKHNLGVVEIGNLRGNINITNGNLLHGGNQVLHAGNYNSYAPTLSGTGATGTWGISISGNAATATTATTANALNTANSYTVAAINTNWIDHNDLDRDANSASYYPNVRTRSATLRFVNASSVGTGGNYAGMLHFSPWAGTTASTGDASYQLAFGSTAANGGGVPQLRLRKGIDTTWNAWLDILTSSNYNSYAPTLTGGGASGTWSINVSGSAGSATGNAGTATTLQTARNINGTSFNGSANITTSSWGTSRTLTIGGTGKSVDGSGNVSWTLSEIGAADNVKVWVNFNGTGTPAIRGSKNVSSLTDNAQGDWTVNFTTAIGNSDYATSGTHSYMDSYRGGFVYVGNAIGETGANAPGSAPEGTEKLSGSCRIQAMLSIAGSVPQDANSVSFILTSGS